MPFAMPPCSLIPDEQSRNEAIMWDLEPRLHEQIPDYEDQLRQSSFARLAGFCRENPRFVIVGCGLILFAVIAIWLTTSDTTPSTIKGEGNVAAPVV